MCTGITLIGADGTAVCGRTMEWSTFDLRSNVGIVPRSLEMVGSTPNGYRTGKRWTSTYGFVGLDALDKPLIADGLNEKGLACGAFYLPGFAEFQTFVPEHADQSIGPLDLTHYLLSVCATVDDVRPALAEVRVVPVVLPELGFPIPLHYRVTGSDGRSLVIQYVRGGEMKVYDNPLGAITNAPEFDWHLINLRNYVNLSAVDVSPIQLVDMALAPFGAGSGMLGLPGDNTPPSRFVSAVAYTQTARPSAGGFDTVKEIIRILDHFQLAAGTGEGSDRAAKDGSLIAGTQWTTAADTGSLAFYYHTAWNRRLRKIDLRKIDFGAGDITVLPLDHERVDDVEDVTPTA